MIVTGRERIKRKRERERETCKRFMEEEINVAERSIYDQMHNQQVMCYAERYLKRERRRLAYLVLHALHHRRSVGLALMPAQ